MDNPYLLNQLARIGGMPNKPVSSDAFNNYVQLGLNVPQPNQGLLNNMNNAIGTIDQENIDKEKLAEKERNRNYNRALLLGVLGDAVSGRSTVERASLLNRNFQADKEKRIAEANQQNLTSNALTIAKANGATDAQLAIIAKNPTIAMSLVQSSLNKPQRRIIKGADGRNYYEDTREMVLPEVPDKPKEITKNSFVVDILTKIQADPTYGSVDNPFTESDQRILDTISNTDPFDIYKREINQKINSRDPKTEIVTEPVTVTTQEQFDKLPKGTRYIYKGNESIKGQ